jgi:glucokinase
MNTLLGLDIGGTRLKAGIVNAADGTLVRQSSRPTPVVPAAFDAAVLELLREVIAGETVDGVGIGTKGIVDPVTNVLKTCPGTLVFLEGRSFPEMVAPALDGRPVTVAADNDARTALAGELVWGAARGYREVVMLTLGTGVGGGIVAGGRILRGAYGVAGHLGHYTVDPRGRSCMCGNRGCLEAYFSAPAIEADARSSVLRGCMSVLTTRFLTRPMEITCEAVFDAAAEGDAIAREIVGEALVRLGGALAGMVFMLDPEIVILGGNITRAGDDALFKPLAADVNARVARLLGRKVPIVKQQLADGSAILGAAALVVGAGAAAGPH